jgi:guanylate kinase
MSNEPAPPPVTGRRGVMLIIASPSGAGKSTLTQRLLQDDRSLSMSVSVTTRPRRPSEIDGIHYHFVASKMFERMRADGELLESAEVHGNRYGTPRAPVEAALAAGRDILFDIDYQGTLQLYETMRPDIVSVFILPPDADQLKARLQRRAEDSAAVIARRLETARTELQHWDKFDYVLVNDDLDRCFTALKAILTAARHARSRLIGLDAATDAMRARLGAMLAADQPAG